MILMPYSIYGCL